jgi:hypothetical protein
MIKKMLKRREECDTYLTHILDITGVERAREKIKYKELSANTMAFISCRSRLWSVYFYS